MTDEMNKRNTLVDVENAIIRAHAQFEADGDDGDPEGQEMFLQGLWEAVNIIREMKDTTHD